MPQAVPELQALEAAQQAAKTLHAHAQQLRADHAAAVKALARLGSLPPGRDDVVASMRSTIDLIADAGAKDECRSIVAAFGGHFELTSAGAFRLVRPTLYEPARDFGRLTFRQLCAFMPDLMKDRLEAIIRATSYEEGSPLALRPARIVNAEARIGVIEAQHTALVDGAASLTPPIVLQLLPSVKARREADAARQQRDADALEARRQLEQRVNASAVGRPPAPSQYLREGSIDPDRADLQAAGRPRAV